MIWVRSWEKVEKKAGIKIYTHVYTGWFLFGIIPIFIKRVTFRG